MSNIVLKMYDQLITVSRKALEQGCYEVAFHALNAALHCAEELEDEHLLLTVKTEAEQQKDFIDHHTPKHRMSTQSAMQRSGRSVYDALIGQAKVYAKQFTYEHRESEY